MAWLARGLYYVLPNLAPFDVKTQVVHAQPIAAGYVALTTGYGVLYITALLTLAVAVLLAAGLQVSRPPAGRCRCCSPPRVLMAPASSARRCSAIARFGTDEPAEQVLYVQSPEVARRLALSYDVLAADVYWIRALQHFGGTRRATDQERELRAALPAARHGDRARPALQHRLPLRRDLPVRAEAGRARPARPGR